MKIIQITNNNGDIGYKFEGLHSEECNNNYIGKKMTKTIMNKLLCENKLI
jgi:hypothetical protein